MRLGGHSAPAVVAQQFVELPPRVSEASRGSATQLGADHPLICLVFVAHQRAALTWRLARVIVGRAEEDDRVLRNASEAEVVHHTRRRIEGTSRVGSDVGPSGLAGARVQHSHRRLVGV